MAALAALEGGAGLASSIITFVSFSVEFGKLVRDVARSQGTLPTELEECRGYIDNVATWVEIIRKTPSPGVETAEENVRLKEAIERCLQTSAQLVSLLSKLSGGNADPDGSKTLTQRTRLVVNSIKRAGKIMWKRDQVKEFRDKLKANREDVHAHIASRTGHHVARIMSKQLEIGDTFQNMDEKFSHAIIRLENLEFQNLCLTAQNQHLIGKVEELCDMMDAIRKHQRKGVAEVFDFVLVSSLWDGMRLAVSNIFDSQQLRVTNQRDEVEDIYRKSILADVSYISGALDALDGGLNVQVIVKGRGKLWDERPILLPLSPADARNDMSVLRAIHKLRGFFEFFSDLRDTTRVTFVRFRQSEDRLSILESRDLAEPSYRWDYINLYQALLREASPPASNARLTLLDERTHLDEAGPGGGVKTQTHQGTNHNTSKNSRIRANTQQGLHDSDGAPSSSPHGGHAGRQKLQISHQNGHYEVGGGSGTVREDPSTSQGQWAIYIERDWGPGVKVFCLYGIPSSSRVISLILLHYRVLSTPLEAATPSKLTLPFAAVGFLTLFYFAESERDRMRAMEFPPAQNSQHEETKLKKLKLWALWMMVLMALSSYLSWSLPSL